MAYSSVDFILPLPLVVVSVAPCKVHRSMVANMDFIVDGV